MKKFLLATTAALTLAAGSAGAADLARPVYKAAPLPPPACAQFGGFYVGGSVGYGYYDNKWSDRDAWTRELDDDLQRSNVSNSKGGWIGGIQGGYNWQTNCTVWGFEADYNWTRLNASSFDTDGDFVPAFIDSLSVNSRLNGIGTLRTRAGVVVDNLLIYVTGGLAYANFQRTYSQTEGFTGFTETLTQNRTRWGWTAGFGTEWAFNQNWSIKSEVLYARFEKDESSFTCALFTCGVARTIRFDNEDSVWTTKIGVNYRFGGNFIGKGPVAARY